MKTETLTRPPDVLPLYAKAGVQVLPDALPGASLLRRVPGASQLPFLGARGGDVPAKQLAGGRTTLENIKRAAERG